MNDTFVIAGLILTLFCGIGASWIAVLPALYPAMAHAPLLPELFRLLAFTFSVGAGAILMKALG